MTPQPVRSPPVCTLAAGPQPDAALLMRHSGAGPRYTSYPTAPLWSSDLTESALHEALRGVRAPASVYVHVPFCVEQCSFCGCNMVVARRQDAGDRYLDDLARRLDRLPLPASRLPVARIHLGGGTPTWLDERQLERLYALLFSRFAPVDGAELSVEADPEVTRDSQVHALAALGVNRLSMGVQSFDPVVLAAVNRPQQHTRVAALIELCRGLGMRSLNLDLMYGLPLQNLVSFEDTLRKTLEMRPDRLAVFGYAHVPWLKQHQNKINTAELPGPPARMELFLLAHRLLSEQGYQAIGMDHFALADDDLAVAQREERLHRNFMGYTTRPDLELIGLGLSAISELDGLYAQELTHLAGWRRALEQGGPLLEKGCRLSAEDRLRRDLIFGLMCNFVVSKAQISARHGVDFDDHFAAELSRLGPLQDEGLVTLSPDRVQVTPLGRLLVRNVAMVFDPSLQKPASGPRFSQTV